MRTPYSFDEEQLEKFMDVVNEYKRPDILEWGGGDSTRYFTRYMNLPGTWTTIEGDIGWYKKIIGWNLEDVMVYYADNTTDEYVNIIERTGKLYDIIFIDGEQRVNCLKKARDFLRKHGCVIIHDAHRTSYQDGMKYYSGEYLTSNKMLWKGVLK